MKSISIVAPAHNEKGNILPFIESVEKFKNEYNVELELIFIDDGSTDSGFEEISDTVKSKAYIKILKHNDCLGLSAALNTGFSNIKNDITIFICTDMSSIPYEDIPKLINKINEGYDLVCGWRQNRSDKKLFVSKIYNILTNYLFSLKLHDQNWIKAFDSKILYCFKDLKYDWHRYIPVVAAYNGFKISEVKTNYYTRKYGKSKFGFKRILRGVLDLIYYKCNYSK